MDVSAELDSLMAAPSIGLHRRVDSYSHSEAAGLFAGLEQRDGKAEHDNLWYLLKDRRKAD